MTVSMSKKWYYRRDDNYDAWPEVGRKVYCKTNQGKYVGHVDENKDIIFDQAIHFNGEITIPPILLLAWRYVSDKEYNELKGFEIVE